MSLLIIDPGVRADDSPTQTIPIHCCKGWLGSSLEHIVAPNTDTVTPKIYSCVLRSCAAALKIREVCLGDQSAGSPVFRLGGVDFPDPEDEAGLCWAQNQMPKRFAAT